VTNVLCLSAGNRKITIGNVLAQAAKTLLSLGAPDCPVRQADSGELAALGKKFTAYNYNSPDCPVSQRSAGPTVGCAIHARHVAEPTVGRGHRTVRCAPDCVRCANGSKAPTVDFAREGKKSAPDSVRWCTGLFGAPGDRRQELPSRIALNGS
jgi:hypothetical protein